MEKIKTDGLRKASRIILWVMVLFIFARGVFSIAFGNDIAHQRALINNQLAIIDTRTALSLNAKAFSENFVREFYTFTGRSNSDYLERVSRFLVNALDIREPTAGISAEVLNASAININHLRDNLFDVDVITIVKYTASGEYADKVTIEELVIRVPLAEMDGRFVVDELPKIIPPIKRADISRQTRYFGTAVERAELATISAFLESFLRAYYMGNQVELVHFTTREFRETYGRGMSGVVNFNRIIDIFAYYDELTGAYVIDARIQIVDGGGQPMEQRFFLTAVRTDGRHHINSMRTRM